MIMKVIMVPGMACEGLMRSGNRSYTTLNKPGLVMGSEKCVMEPEDNKYVTGVITEIFHHICDYKREVDLLTYIE